MAFSLGFSTRARIEKCDCEEGMKKKPEDEQEEAQDGPEEEQKEKYGKVMKFNTHHDPQTGRFTSGSPSGYNTAAMGVAPRTYAPPPVRTPAVRAIYPKTYVPPVLSALQVRAARRAKAPVSYRKAFMTMKSARLPAGFPEPTVTRAPEPVTDRLYNGDPRTSAGPLPYRPPYPEATLATLRPVRAKVRQDVENILRALGVF